MAGIPADVDPSNIRSTGREKKCGTCRNMTVKPPEVELARYALPIGACAPGVKCLGGAVRGMCQALGVVVESTSMVPNVPCKGRLYVAGGPSIQGTEGMDEQTRAAVMGMAGSMNTAGRSVVARVTDGGMASMALVLAGVVAGPALKWASDQVMGAGSGSSARKYVKAYPHGFANGKVEDYGSAHISTGPHGTVAGPFVFTPDGHHRLRQGWRLVHSADKDYPSGWGLSGTLAFCFDPAASRDEANALALANYKADPTEVSRFFGNTGSRARPVRTARTDDPTRTVQGDEPTDWADRPPRGVELKPGRYLLDPHGRVVTVVRALPDDTVQVRLAGPRGTTSTYPVSTLRPPWVDAGSKTKSRRGGRGRGGGGDVRRLFADHARVLFRNSSYGDLYSVDRAVTLDDGSMGYYLTPGIGGPSTGPFREDSLEAFERGE